MNATVGLSAVAVQDYFIDGQPVLAGQVFVYAAGTTTKITTYTDSTGATPQTNPIRTNSRGEPEGPAGQSVGIWVPAGVAYKLVFATPTDSDPPTNPIWTVDNLGSTVSGATGGVINIAGLRSVGGSPISPASIYVQGYYEPGDGGGGWYVLLNSGSGLSDNGGTVIVVGSNTWLRESPADGSVSPKWFGAPTNGTVGADAAAIQAAINWQFTANNGGVVALGPYQYNVGTTTIQMQAGVWLLGVGRGGVSGALQVSSIAYTGTVAAIASINPSVSQQGMKVGGIFISATGLSSGGAVIDATGFQTGEIRDNEIVGNGTVCYGIKLGSSNVALTIGENLIENNGFVQCDTAIYLYGIASSTTIRRNRIQPQQGGIGILLDDSTTIGDFPNQIFITENVIEESLTDMVGIDIVGLANGVVVTGNRMEFDDAAGCTGIFIGSTCFNITLFGNYYSGVTQQLDDSGRVAMGIDDALTRISVAVVGTTGLPVADTAQGVTSTSRTSAGLYVINYPTIAGAPAAIPKVAALGNGVFPTIISITNTAATIETLNTSNVATDCATLYFELS